MKYKFSRPDLFESWEVPNWDDLSGKLILYGAGKAGDVIAYALEQRGIEYICWCDSEKSKQGKIYRGHKIISPEILRETYVDHTVVITTSHYKEVATDLHSLGIVKTTDAHSVLLEFDFDRYIDTAKYAKDDFSNAMSVNWAARIANEYLASIAVHKSVDPYSTLAIPTCITTRCSLRCRHCSALIPYFESPCHFDTHGIIKSLDSVMSAFNFVQELPVLGGEPLLHPDIADITLHCLKFGNVERVSIVTNGTIIPSKELLNVMQNSKFFLRLSNYGKLSDKAERIIKLCEIHGIAYENTDYKFWCEGTRIDNYNRPHTETIRLFTRCTDTLRHKIHNGRFYLCCVGGDLCDLGIFDANSDNSVELLSNANAAAEIHDLVMKIHRLQPMDMCRYCSGMPQIHFDKRLPVAEQTHELLKIEKPY
jgi:hypothetical protein